MRPANSRLALCGALLGTVLFGCSGGETTATPAPAVDPVVTPPVVTPPVVTPPGVTAREAAALGDSLPNGLLVATSQFLVTDGRVTATPGPARLDLVYRRGGEWRVETLEDPDSNVFHKAMVYDPPGDAPPGILTVGGMGAEVKLWRRSPEGTWTAEVLWSAEFGGRWNRMRDVEVAPLFGAAPGPGGVIGDALAIATHDQGVVAIASLRTAAGGTATGGTAGGYEITELDRTANTFVHEIELGDLDGDGAIEIYATPSEPNSLEGGVTQHGEVVRYIPGTPGRTVVADLGNRHAKEILVDDVDGDGRDELYVAVEALTRGTGDAIEIAEPVEIRRYDAETPNTGGVVIATIRDRLTRFLTVGDVDGDGRREMVAAAFSSGLWLLRPGRDPRGEWSIENIDRESSGFEHAALLTDLDGDHIDELYVGSDNERELRRYVWVNGRARREVIREIAVARSLMTWNLMPFPVATFIPEAGAATPTGGAPAPTGGPIGEAIGPGFGAGS